MRGGSITRASKASPSAVCPFVPVNPARSPLKSKARSGAGACSRIARSMAEAITVLPEPLPPMIALCGEPL